MEQKPLQSISKSERALAERRWYRRQSKIPPWIFLHNTKEGVPKIAKARDPIPDQLPRLANFTENSLSADRELARFSNHDSTIRAWKFNECKSALQFGRNSKDFKSFHVGF